MKILDRMPYYETPTLLSFGETTVEIRRFQILVWVRLRSRRFPAILDTGHSHNFLLSERHLHDWAEVDSLEQIGQVEVNRTVLPQFAADLWLHANQRGTRNALSQSHRLVMHDGITVVPEGAPNAPRLPLLGLKAITTNKLRLMLDGKRREVTLSLSGWF